jgi:predicted NBD/HSP70 family sugar kinase
MTDTRLLPKTFQRARVSEVANASERAVLEILRQSGPLTRSEIARRSGLSAMTITRISDALEARGFLRSVGKITEGRGANEGLEINPNAAFCIGVSIRTDSVAVSLMDFAGALRGSRSQLVPDMQKAITLERIGDLMADVIRNEVPDKGRLFGLGVAISGFFIGEGSKVNPPDLLEDWALTDVEAILAERFKLPVWVDNDGNAAALAEAMFGLGLTYPSFAYMYFSTDFGGGIVQNGAIWRGRHGNAGEFAGAIPLDGFVHPNLENLRRVLCAQGTDIPTVAEMVAHFDPSWPAVETWLDQVTPALNIAASAASAVLDPDAIILGGILPQALGEKMIKRIRFSSGARRGLIRPVPLVLCAEITQDAAAIGAAAAPFKAHFFGN